MNYYFYNYISEQVWMCDDSGYLDAVSMSASNLPKEPEEIVRFVIGDNLFSPRIYPNADWHTYMTGQIGAEMTLYFWFEGNGLIKPEKEEAIINRDKGIHIFVLSDTETSINSNVQFTGKILKMSIKDFCNRIVHGYKAEKCPSPDQWHDIKTLLDSINQNILTLSHRVESLSCGTPYGRNSSLSESDKKYLDQKFNHLVDQYPNTGGNETLLNQLNEELSQYKNDFYFKNQRTGLDGMIEILDDIYIRIQNQSDDSIKKALVKVAAMMERRMERCFHVVCRHSAVGTPFDGKIMYTHEDMISTSDVTKKSTVAVSMTPAVFWCIPRVNAEGQSEFLYQQELVILYK